MNWGLHIRLRILRDGFHLCQWDGIKESVGVWFGKDDDLAGPNEALLLPRSARDHVLN
jgi:hypothetical protein